MTQNVDCVQSWFNPKCTSYEKYHETLRVFHVALLIGSLFYTTFKGWRSSDIKAFMVTSVLLIMYGTIPLISGKDENPSADLLLVASVYFFVKTVIVRTRSLKLLLVLLLLLLGSIVTNMHKTSSLLVLVALLFLTYPGVSKWVDTKFPSS